MKTNKIEIKSIDEFREKITDFNILKDSITK